MLLGIPKRSCNGADGQSLGFRVEEVGFGACFMLSGRILSLRGTGGWVFFAVSPNSLLEMYTSVAELLHFEPFDCMIPYRFDSVHLFCATQQLRYYVELNKRQVSQHEKLITASGVDECGVFVF